MVQMWRGGSGVRAWTLFSRLLYGFATAPHDLQNASEQAPSFAGTRLCRHQALQAPGFATPPAMRTFDQRSSIKDALLKEQAESHRKCKHI
jgi:hypothetical protein